MKTGKLKKFETVAAPGIIADTPEELAALIAELLLIAERMPLEKIIPKNVTKNNSGDAEILDKKNLTKFDIGTDAKTDTKINSGDDTGTFSSEQLRILESLKDAE
jgi:hypothetical protein